MPCIIIMLHCIIVYIHVVFQCHIHITHTILHSAKGGAVERGCSDLYGVIHDVTTQYYPNPLHPPPTAPPCTVSFHNFKFVFAA